MSTLSKIEKEARRLCRHTVCFTDSLSQMIAVRALQGSTTKAIAEEFGIKEGKVQYAILKAQNSMGEDVRFRRDYRSGKSELSKKMRTATDTIALRQVRRKIAPKFAKLAAPGVPRLT